MPRRNHRRRRPHGTYAAGPFKRTFDLVLALALSIATLPVVLALALGSAIAFRAWPFFTQERLGKDGVPFRFVKVRSLPTSVPRYIDKHRLAEQSTSRWGKVLRVTHLDELPQLWLVVTGRMSLVGPRPEMAAVAAHFNQDFVAARTTVRPGCTGPWQVSTSYQQLIGSDTRFDHLYLQEASLAFDLRVLWWTVVQRLGAPLVPYDRMLAVVGADPIVVRIGGQVIDLRGPDTFSARLLQAIGAPEVAFGDRSPAPATID